MREKDIRSLDRAHHQALERQEQERLLRQAQRFAEVPCPACEGREAELYFQRDGFTFKRCTTCSTVYVSPRPSVDLLLDHYRNSLAEKYWYETVIPQSAEARARLIMAPRIERIAALCRRHGFPQGAF